MKEYELKTYKQFSHEFIEACPMALRAFLLIPLMYDRLTLVDGYSHKEASHKIIEDHKHLTGFSDRNFRRYLPKANPNVPRRIRTPCPKIENDTAIGEGLQDKNVQDGNKIADNDSNLTDSTKVSSQHLDSNEDTSRRALAIIVTKKFVFVPSDKYPLLAGVMRASKDGFSIQVDPDFVAVNIFGGRNKE